MRIGGVSALSKLWPGLRTIISIKDLEWELESEARADNSPIVKLAHLLPAIWVSRHDYGTVWLKDILRSKGMGDDENKLFSSLELRNTKNNGSIPDTIPVSRHIKEVFKKAADIAIENHRNYFGSGEVLLALIEYVQTRRKIDEEIRPVLELLRDVPPEEIKEKLRRAYFEEDRAKGHLGK